MFRITKWLKVEDHSFLESERVRLEGLGFHVEIKEEHGRYALFREVEDMELDDPEFSYFVKMGD